MKHASPQKVFLLCVIFLAIGLAAGFYFSPPALKEAAFPLMDISSVLPEIGYMAANASIQRSRVTLAAGCDALSFDVTDDQALSIRLGLEKRVFSRPLSHDIMKDVLDHYNISVKSVAIDVYEDEVYKAKIFLRQQDKILKIDSRPSDAIAMAVREGMRVMVKDDIMKSRGENIC